MLKTIAISSYRSLLNFVIPLQQLNVISGPNGSGKSNIYRALRLLAESANGRLIGCIAAEGGLPSALWAGPQARTPSSSEPMPLDSMNKGPYRLQLGFASDEFTYSIDLGLTPPSGSAFGLDPIIKRECVWLGSKQTGSALCADRHGSIVKCRNREGKWTEISNSIASYEGLMSRYADPLGAPELVYLRDQMLRWRFYDCLRTDPHSPARQMQIGTPFLAHDGSNVAAALQTIRESGSRDLLDEAIDDAFPGSTVEVACNQGRFEIQMQQPGMKRPMAVGELSEGTLRFLMLATALLSTQPPELLVLNEPETHLHPDLVPALGKLVARCSTRAQILVVTHSYSLSTALGEDPDCAHFAIEKESGSTFVKNMSDLDWPFWKWPPR
jgi:predicted ATPase